MHPKCCVDSRRVLTTQRLVLHNTNRPLSIPIHRILPLLAVSPRMTVPFLACLQKPPWERKMTMRPTVPETPCFPPNSFAKRAKGIPFSKLSSTQVIAIPVLHTKLIPIIRPPLPSVPHRPRPTATLVSSQTLGTLSLRALLMRKRQMTYSRWYSSG